MKKLLILLLAFLLFSCDSIPDNIVESVEPEVAYNVESIEAPNEFVFNRSDSLINFKITLTKLNGDFKVYFNIINPNGDKLFPGYLELNKYTELTSSNSIEFSGEYPLSSNDLIGAYTIVFYADGNSGQKLIIANHYFDYKVINYPPVIKNLVMTDSIDRGSSFVFYLNAEDKNGIEDIKYVYFYLFRPDGSQVTANSNNGDKRFPMFDDGNSAQSGDMKAGDGIYSLKNSFADTAPTGTWRFEFEAVDQSDSLSNKISHNLEVK